MKRKIKLPKTEEFIKEGIVMRKKIDSASYGLFFSKEATYDYKTVYDLEEAIQLNQDGWYFESENFFDNLALYMWRDLH